LKLFKWLVSNEEGSAVLEFVAIALPLFIPLFIFLNNYANTSDAQGNLRTLSREMARAFVISENDKIAGNVAYEVFVKGANVLGYGNSLNNGKLSYSITCSNSPCISPNSEVLVTLKEETSNVEISTVEYVSPWA
jgi:Flp pilus assembly protein TadG